MPYVVRHDRVCATGHRKFQNEFVAGIGQNGADVKVNIRFYPVEAKRPDDLVHYTRIQTYLADRAFTDCLILQNQRNRNQRRPIHAYST